MDFPPPQLPASIQFHASVPRTLLGLGFWVEFTSAEATYTPSWAHAQRLRNKIPTFSKHCNRIPLPKMCMTEWPPQERTIYRRACRNSANTLKPNPFSLSTVFIFVPSSFAAVTGHRIERLLRCSGQLASFLPDSNSDIL